MQHTQKECEVEMKKIDEALLTTSQVARMIEMSQESVRVYNRSGLLPATRTAGGIRLFKREDVERFRTERQKKLD
jgi:excisionase family DNA binding protein